MAKQIVTAGQVIDWLTPAAQAAGLAQEELETAAPLLSRYGELLLGWGASMNLVGVKQPRRLMEELVADSLHLAGFLREHHPGAALTYDLGAGAGLPGIPLRFFYGSGEHVMAEVREKRVIFLRYAIAELGLQNVRVVHGPAEELIAGKQADIVTARAFLPWPELLRLVAGDDPEKCAALVSGGRVVVLASEPPPAADDPRVPAILQADAWRRYETAAGERYFWSFSSSSSSESSLFIPASTPR
ncbi:16S rRNA (guanine(527)-N(7))-methyltransferase RsmG [Oceanidesulfovibrio indonesiensis]|nr:RsmG family class I SAM-dependent methyltransferase [Oceanidesulfovibrio indonesiensis]